MALGAAAARAFGPAERIAARFPPRWAAAGDADCPELGCLHGLLDAKVRAAARQRAADIGPGADRVLIAAGAISEDEYLHTLAQDLGVGFEPLDGVPRRFCPLDDAQLLDSAARGILPLAGSGEIVAVITPRGLAARRVAAAVKADPALARCFRLTTAERLNRFVLRHAGKALAKRAAHALRRQSPHLSAAPPRWRMLIVPFVTIAGTALIAMAAQAAAPVTAFEILAASLAALFMTWLGLRVAAAIATPPEPAPSRSPPDRALPVYTVICALYREAASVGELLAALRRLDYPREKLQVIFALEADDAETRAAIEARKRRLPVTLITVPASGPRTKPKALNAALAFAHGSFTVIYDAEDRPEPDQLRHALQAFGSGGDKLACVQARLCIDNTADGWLARGIMAQTPQGVDAANHIKTSLCYFFEWVIGGVCAIIPHFRTAMLRGIGGWDPYNVTEDADLGMRLARFGYRSATIASTTSEEAPARIGPWLRQRTRWFKGWMQTWAVHMRTPRRLLRELGLPGFLAFQLSVGGNALAALVHPVFLATLIHAAFMGVPPWRGGWMEALYGGAALAGYLVSALIAVMGLARRRLLNDAYVLTVLPVHWVLLSLAAWRALFQLIFAPYAWEKTEHGLAKTSRLTSDTTRRLVKLERHLSYLMETGQLPSLF